MIQFFLSLNTPSQVKKYHEDILNRSIDPSHGDTMQVFIGSCFLHGSQYHLYYTGNSYNDGDIDRGFMAKGNTITTLNKILLSGEPKVILDAGTEIGGQDSIEVFIRHVYYDTDLSLYRMYYTVKPDNFPTSQHYTSMATAVDGENFTKTGKIYERAGEAVVNWAMWKNSINDYVAVSTYIETGTGDYKFRFLTSTDGIAWTDVNEVVLPDTRIIRYIYKDGSVYYLFANTGYNDPAVSVADNVTVYTTQDFLTVSLMGDILTKDEPNERGLGTCVVLPQANNLDLIYHYQFNQNKSPANGGEAYTEIRRATLNSLKIQIGSIKNIYPSYTKRYWPLYHSDESNSFHELIGGNIGSLGSPSWDTLKFLDLTSTQISFTETPLEVPNYVSIKMRVVIITDATRRDIYRRGTDIEMWLQNGFLNVALNDSTKHYVANDVIALPPGIGDPAGQDAVYVGFIFSFGALQLCVGNDTNVAITKTLDGFMTEVDDTATAVTFADAEMRSATMSHNITAQQWIDLDL